MPLRDLDDLGPLFASMEGRLVGVGMTAYPRITPCAFIRPYHIVALRKTRDLSLLRERAGVFCLEEQTDDPLEEENSARLLSHPGAREFLAALPERKVIFLYQSYGELEALAGGQGWKLLANPASLRVRVAERAFFEDLTGKLQINRVPGRFFPLASLYSTGYADWSRQMGSRFVVQLPEIGQGGGRGTFFIAAHEDYERLLKRLKQGTWRGRAIRTIYVRRYIEGLPVSLALCITRQGILMSGLQTQLIDLPYCEGLEESGVFCGHSWGEVEWPASVRKEAARQGRIFGESLAAMGYRGILGIDFVMEAGGQRLYPLEINPRLTGAFPVLSQIHMKHGLIPMEALHILEFLGIPYDIDVKALNAQYNRSMQGGHLLLFHSGHSGAEREVSSRGLEAGIYEFEPRTGKMMLVRKDSGFEAIRNERQFMITDGPPAGRTAPREPLSRLCRLLFSHPIADVHGTITRETMLSVNRVLDGIFAET